MRTVSAARPCREVGHIDNPLPTDHFPPCVGGYVIELPWERGRTRVRLWSPSLHAYRTG